jgi:hypothetical protein
MVQLFYDDKLQINLKESTLTKTKTFTMKSVYMVEEVLKSQFYSIYNHA